MYEMAMEGISDTYDTLIKTGAKVEDARGVLPTNIHTNIVMGANMRTMVEMIRKRTSPRTQGEYRDVLEGLRSEMLRVHPWVSLFIERDADKASRELYGRLNELDMDEVKRTELIKLLDQVRQN